MRRKQLPVLMVLGLLSLAAPVTSTAAAKPSIEARTAHYLATIRSSPAKLRAFLKAMPKGADLHNHLSGAVPTEALIDFAINDGLCIDATFTATAPCQPGQRPASDSNTDPAFKAQIVRAWSMEGFPPGESGHNHFFDTFGKFGLATSPASPPRNPRKGEMLAVVAKINASQHVGYLETLVSRQSAAVATLAGGVTVDPISPDFPAVRQQLLDRGLASVVTQAIADTDTDFARYNELLRCGARRADAACEMEVRFDYQVGRTASPAVVFTNLLLGFELQRRDPRYVGVNLVQPEDNAAALSGYLLQMQMIQYLRTLYPGAHVTLHAGEITPGLVSPLDLRSHIRDAVEIAGAERIGHGVDVVNEFKSGQLLGEMARRHVLVEVPLTSNEQILGVFGAAHPFVNYRAAGVPVALATDDPGVERVDVTHEYQIATTRYRLGYDALKTLSRASLEHSFLPGASIWRSPDDFRLAKACAGRRPGAPRPARRCQALLRRSTKATAQWKLETAFRSFERRQARR